MSIWLNNDVKKTSLRLKKGVSMALKALQKNKNIESVKVEKSIDKFISKGGTLATPIKEQKEDDNHRLTLRIPKWLLAKIDVKKNERVGKISRNLWILEVIERACKE